MEGSKLAVLRRRVYPLSALPVKPEKWEVLVRQHRRHKSQPSNEEPLFAFPETTPAPRVVTPKVPPIQFKGRRPTPQPQYYELYEPFNVQLSDRSHMRIHRRVHPLGYATLYEFRHPKRVVARPRKRDPAFAFLFEPKKEVYVKPNFAGMDYNTKVAALKLLVNDPLLYTDPYTLVNLPTLSQHVSTAASDDTQPSLCPGCLHSVLLIQKAYRTLQASLAEATATITQLKQDKKILKASLAKVWRSSVSSPERSRLNALREALVERDRIISDLRLVPESGLKPAVDQAVQHLLRTTSAYPEVQSLLQAAVNNFEPPARFLLSALQAAQALLRHCVPPRNVLEESEALLAECSLHFTRVRDLNQDLAEALASAPRVGFLSK